MVFPWFSYSYGISCMLRIPQSSPWDPSQLGGIGAALQRGVARSDMDVDFRPRSTEIHEKKGGILMWFHGSKPMVPLVNIKIAGIYGCPSH